MSVVSRRLDLAGGAEGCAVFVDSAGALAPDSIVMYIGGLVRTLNISYGFGSRVTCELPALLTSLDAKRLYVNDRIHEDDCVDVKIPLYAQRRSVKIERLL